MSNKPIDQIKNLVENTPVVIFSLSYCNYCKDAIELLNNKGKAFTTVEVDKLPNKREIFKALKEFSGLNTFPNIYIAGNHIGGLGELQNLDY